MKSKIKKIVTIALATTMLLGATLTASAGKNCPICGYPTQYINGADVCSFHGPV